MLLLCVILISCSAQPLFTSLVSRCIHQPNKKSLFYSPDCLFQNPSESCDSKVKDETWLHTGTHKRGSQKNPSFSKCARSNSQTWNIPVLQVPGSICGKRGEAVIMPHFSVGHYKYSDHFDSVVYNHVYANFYT